MTLTRDLVRFATELRYQDIPGPILHKLRLHWLDGISCGYAASLTTAGQQARAAALLLGGGDGQCRMLGPSTRQRSSPPAAAFANALQINALDFDDGVEIDGKGMGHPGATLIPAALAALDQSASPIPAERLLTALAAGFEINNRLIHALQPSAPRFAEVYGIAQHQAIGAAIVYGLTAGVDANRLHHAIGLAATLSCVPSLHKYNWDQRPLVSLKDGVASAAQAGVQAACMASMGFIGSLDVLDGPQGYWRMQGSDRFDATLVRQDLGQSWYVRYGSFKRYPACRWLASALECMERLMHETRWRPEDIQKIEVRTFSRAACDFMDLEPANSTDAQFSLPYTLAAAAMGLAPGKAWYEPEAWHSPVLRGLMQRTQACVDPYFEARMQGAGRQPGAAITLTTHSGRSATAQQDIPSGSAALPLPDEHIIAKAKCNLESDSAQADTFIARLLDAAWWQQTALPDASLLLPAANPPGR